MIYDELNSDETQKSSFPIFKSNIISIEKKAADKFEEDFRELDPDEVENTDNEDTDDSSEDDENSDDDDEDDVTFKLKNK